jgi:hypothetical protein
MCEQAEFSGTGRPPETGIKEHEVSISVRTLPDGYRELQISDQLPGSEAADRYVRELCDAVGVMLFRAGSSIPDVDFLRELPGLRSVRLNGDIRDISAVFEVSGLRRLDLLHCRPPALVHFDRLPALEVLDFTWGPDGGETIESLGALRSLYLAEWRGDRLPLGKSPLRELRLEAGRKAVLRWADLEPVTETLEEVDIDSAELLGDESVTLPSLRRVKLERCKVPDLGFLSGAGALRQLELEGCGAIASLAGLAGLPRLEVLLISGNTNIVDGDLEMLYQLPALREVALERGRPHYSRKPAEIRRDFPLSD